MVNATPGPSYAREKALVTMAHEAGWPPGPVWFRTPNRPACSESLNRLRSSGPLRRDRLREIRGSHSGQFNGSCLHATMSAHSAGHNGL